MTIKQIFNKVAIYNEVAEFALSDRVKLVVVIDGSAYDVVTLGSFRKKIKDTFIDCVAEGILTASDYKIGKANYIESTDRFAERFVSKVEFAFWDI